MKVVEPSRLMQEAADALEPIRDEVVVIGAIALEAALAGRDARSAATTDVDCAVDMGSAAAVISALEDAGLYREPVAFQGRPDQHRLWVARPAAVMALKGHAFGRLRPTGELVERDYHDAYLLIAHAGDEIAAEFNGTDDGQLRGLIRNALRDLQEEPVRAAVGKQIVQLEAGVSAREADARLARAATTFIRLLS